MNAARRRLLLLCCSLGEPGARPLSAAEYHRLRRQLLAVPPAWRPADPLSPEGLAALGCGGETALRIAGLLRREAVLDRYLAAGERLGIYPVTLQDRDYPAALRRLEGPPCFFARGERRLLAGPFVAVAGARNAGAAALRFAAQVGELAAREGLVLVTGGARGADKAALLACLRAGGRCLTFVPDALRDRGDLEPGADSLALSAEGYDAPFTAARALQRNVFIHAMGEKTFIAQTGFGRGGTWRGSLENLRRGLSRLYVLDDGSAGAAALLQRGALPVRPAELDTLAGDGRGTK